MAQQLAVEQKNGVAHLTFQRPEKLNALNGVLISAIAGAFQNLAGDGDLRCVVLSGAGRGFSAGADVAELNALTQESAEEFIRALHGACQAVWDCTVPVIARIDGPCLGGALELAASCDMRAASERSTFAMPEVQVGLPSMIEAALLPRLLGWGRACEMLLTGHVLTAQEALQAVLVEKVVAPARLDGVVTEWTDAIRTAGPRAIRAQKALMRRWEIQNVDQAIESGVTAFCEAFGSDEPQRKLHEVLARRKG